MDEIMMPETGPDEIIKSETNQEKPKKSKTLPILLTILIVLILAGAVYLVLK